MPINPNDITTIRVGELAHELPQLTDKIPHEIGTDLFHCTIQDLVNLFLINANAFQYEIKTLYVNQTYIDNNLDSTGLGINLLVGWAKVNGNNGTPPMAGLVEIAEGTGYAIGSFGGAKELPLTVDQLPPHSHTLFFEEYATGETGSPGYDGGNNQYTTDQTKITSIVGQGDPVSRMQPYIVVLKIMKL